MTDERPESEQPRIAREIYELLAASTPGERTEITLRLISEHPEGRLDVPVLDDLRALLDEIDLTQTESGFHLQGANLRGASLRKAVLRSLDLARADLRGSALGEADLHGVCLDEAKLQNADLAGANLRGASLGKADLRGTLLEEANLEGATLRFANLQEAALEKAVLRGADLWGAGLQQAILAGADLRGAILREADLQGADLSGANLEGAVLDRTDFRGANLAEAMLQGASLTTCRLEGVSWRGTWLERTRMRPDQLGNAIGEELARDYEGAAYGYLALERNFTGIGDTDAARWAYLKRRRTQKQASYARASAAYRERRWSSTFRNGLQYASDQLAEWVCDYGESVPRVLASLVVLYLIFTVLYGVTGSVVSEIQGPEGVERRVTHRPVDLAIFSLLAMTTGNLGVRLLPRSDLALLLVGTHVFLSIALIGLLGFVLGNRIRR
jgi:uncharacterized protein YjbI with pentapeptide repeats